MSVLVLQHIACEPPGAFEDVMVERGLAIQRVELDEGEPLPPTLEGIDAVVAMGGPMSVNDESEHPWLVAEKRLIREAVEGGLPFWGSCLGVQLLASSLGARVHAGNEPEVGVLPVFPAEATAADPVLGPLAWPRPTLQWHGDTFDLPVGATLLATSPAYVNQAFRVGDLAYGVQFHVEVTAEMADEWGRVPAYERAARAVLGDGGLERLLADFRAAMPEMITDARALFGRWLDLWRPKPSQRPDSG
jgi:GMP synthase (glutamine-hydrolysing)